MWVDEAKMFAMGQLKQVDVAVGGMPGRDELSAHRYRHLLVEGTVHNYCP